MPRFTPIWFFCFCFFLPVMGAFAQPYAAKLIEEVTQTGQDFVIPYKKYQLPNGLLVIIHEDHSDPIAYVNVTYHVGSAREEMGKSGFAHFFEHMMYESGGHLIQDNHRYLAAKGASFNGSTNDDFTQYFEEIPANEIENTLWIQSDRMGFLLNAITKEKFESVRATVKNERDQRNINQPYGLVDQTVNQALYPYGHPYSWPTIGYEADLNRVEAKDVKNFFIRWYGPNNATLTIAGDVNTSQVLSMVEKYFGSIPSGPTVIDQKIPAPVLDADRYESLEDNVHFPMLKIVFPGVPAHHPDEAALDCLAELLGGNEKTSLFYQHFIKPQKAIQATVGDPTRELAGEFDLEVVAYPNFNLRDIEQEIKKILDEFEQRGVTDDDIQRFIGHYQSRLIYSMEEVSNKGYFLAFNQTMYHDANQIQADIKRLKGVSKEDLMRVYRQYIKGKHAVVLSVVPKGHPEIGAHPGVNYVVDKTGYKAPPIEKVNLKYPGVKDNFSRDAKPRDGTFPEPKIPIYWQKSFANGLKILGTENHEVPTVYLQVNLEGGRRLEAGTPTKAGISALTASLIENGSEKFTAEAFSDALTRLGSRINVSTSEEQITFTVRSLKQNLDSTLYLLEQCMLHPRFDTLDFSRVKKVQLELIANDATRPGTIANNAFDGVLRSNDPIMSLPERGTPQTVQSITLDDVKQFYQSSFSPSVTSVAVVGDITQEQIVGKLSFLDAWPAKPITLPANISPPTIEKTSIYLADKPGAVQSEIRVGYIALPYDALGEYEKANDMAYLLTSRLYQNLREIHGYTYSVSSDFYGRKTPGPFVIITPVRTNATASAIDEIMTELRQYQKRWGTSELLQDIKTRKGLGDVRKFESYAQKANYLNRINDFNLPNDYISQQNKLLQNLTEEEVNHLAKEYLPFKKMVIVVVGDKAKIQTDLKELGYDLFEIDNNGHLLKKIR